MTFMDKLVTKMCVL